MVPDRPRSLPAIRDRVAEMSALAVRRHPGGVEAGMRTFGWELRTVADPDLRMIWVSEEMCELLVEVASSVPEDTRLDEVVRPVSGLVVYEHAIVGRDVLDPRRTVDIHGQMFGPAYLDPAECPHPGISIGTLSYNTLRFFAERLAEESDLPVAEVLSRVQGQVLDEADWYPVGRAEWLENEALGEVSRPNTAVGDTAEEEELYVRSAVEDRSLLVALLTLMHSDRFAEVGEWRPNKKQRRRLGRRPGDLVVTTLRSPAPDAGGATEGSGRKLDHRTWVAPYFRMQPHGPGRSLRRLQLIEGHVRGPEGAPLRRSTRVWSLRR